MLLLNQSSTDFLLNNLHAVSSFYWVLYLWVPSVVGAISCKAPGLV